jgi:hypothetical protein
MVLDSYTYENCILQRTESVYHLLLRCSFSSSCWALIFSDHTTNHLPTTSYSEINKTIEKQMFNGDSYSYGMGIWKCQNGSIF